MRRTSRTTKAETRWSGMCLDTRGEPAATERCPSRLERGLVNRRARLSLVESRLIAVGRPATEVEVFYATNREPWRRARRWYHPRDAGTLEYGIVTVHVPENHPAGKLEKALSVSRVDVLPVEEWESRLAAQSRGASVLTYVHGFNNSFAYAARRTAQISHDVRTAVVPVLFSWPSHGGTPLAGAKYTFDENAAARSSPAFAQLLDRLLAVDGPVDAEVSVLAHSLGTRVVADALLDLQMSDTPRRPLQQLILSAPDIDTSVFARRYLPRATQLSERLTIYCARDDRAIRLSRRVHGGYERLGSCRPEPMAELTSPDLEIIDGSRLTVSVVDHNKVSSSPRLLHDLTLVLHGLPATHPARALIARDTHHELPP